MEKFVLKCLKLSFALLFLGCIGEKLDKSELKAISNVSSIFIDVYKEHLSNNMSIIYLSESSSILIKSSGTETLTYQESLAPPPSKNGLKNLSHGASTTRRIDTEIIKIKEETKKEIEKLIKAFHKNDFDSVINNIKTEKGIGIKVIFISPNNNIKEFNLINGATDNQRNFFKYVFDKAIEKSVRNKEQLEFFLR